MTSAMGAASVPIETVKLGLSAVVVPDVLVTPRDLHIVDAVVGIPYEVSGEIAIPVGKGTITAVTAFSKSPLFKIEVFPGSRDETGEFGWEVHPWVVRFRGELAGTTIRTEVIFRRDLHSIGTVLPIRAFSRHPDFQITPGLVDFGRVDNEGAEAMSRVSLKRSREFSDAFRIQGVTFDQMEATQAEIELNSHDMGESLEFRLRSANHVRAAWSLDQFSFIAGAQTLRSIRCPFV